MRPVPVQWRIEAVRRVPSKSRGLWGANKSTCGKEFDESHGGRADKYNQFEGLTL